MIMTAKATDRLVLGALAVATALFFWDALLMRGTFFVQDVMMQNYPFRDFFARALKELELPLWHPGINFGFPLFAEGQAGALYPLNLLLGLLFPTHVGLNLSVIVHTWLAAAGTYGFTRLLGCRRSAATTAGLTYAFSGFLIVRMMSQNYQVVAAWLPFLFLLIEQALKGRRPWTWFGMMAGVVGVQFLAGHPQATLYGLVAASLYGFVRKVSSGDGRSNLIAIVAVPVIGAGLAAVQLLPTWELVQLSGRGDGLAWETFVSMSMPPERLITLLVPNFYGNSAIGTYWAQEHGFFIQLCPYIGILPLLLCFSAARHRRDVPTVFFVTLSALALLLSLGKYTTLYSLVYQLPGLSFFRIPTRFLLWWALGGAVLAGLGLDRMLASRTADSSPSRGWTGAWGFVVATLAVTMLWLNRQAFSAAAGEWLTQFQPVAATVLARYGLDVAWDLVRLVGMASIGLIVFSRLWRGRSRSWGWVVAGLVFIDLYSFGAAFNPLLPAEVYSNVPASARVILDRTQSAHSSSNPGSTSGVPSMAGFRVASLISESTSSYDWHAGWALDPSSYAGYPETLKMYSGSLYGLANTLPGWSPLHLRSQWQFISGHPKLFPVANTRFRIHHNKAKDNSLQLIHDGIVKVYEDPAFLPRTYIAGADTVISQAAGRVRFMRTDEFAPNTQAVLSNRPWGRDYPSLPPAAGGDLHQSQITLYQPEEVHVDLGSHNGGVLVLSDTYYPGWRAWVDGREVPIAEANHVFRAVPVRAGDHEVIFRFESTSFRAGIWVSLVSALLVVLAMWKARNLTPLPLEVEETGAARFVEHVRHWALQVGLIIVLHAVCRLWPLWAQAADRARMPSHWLAGW